ncbi:hypothetical protein GCM10010363_73680 [Streptomyces omiyaensis]|nr:hypothetical protein GCM10010363_73680 [Streptomyces omiyaensis]
MPRTAGAISRYGPRVGRRPRSGRREGLAGIVQDPLFRVVVMDAAAFAASAAGSRPVSTAVM